MRASGVVPGLDPGKYGQPCFSFVFPGAPIDQFTFQAGKKALSHCVIIGITYTAHRGAYAHFLASLAELNVETTAANCHDSKPLLRLLDKARRSDSC